MANSANFARNLQQKPSVFEITASEFLDNLLYPAFSKIFDFFGLNYNFRILNFNITENISPVVTILLQYLYLRKRGGSFGESFYGLQRADETTGNIISHSQQLISASSLTLLPFIERKLKERVSQHEESAFEKLVLKLFYIHNIAKVVHTFLYLTKYSASHSPIFRLLGLNLGYPQATLKNDKSTLIILKSLEVIAFFVQFLQWWYTNNSRQKIGSLKNPDSCDKNKSPKKEIVSTNICPICMQKISNPAASSISGYVYCMKCIASHLKQNKTCPVSGYPMSVDDLVRIFDN